MPQYSSAFIPCPIFGDLRQAQDASPAGSYSPRSRSNSRPSSMSSISPKSGTSSTLRTPADLPRSLALDAADQSIYTEAYKGYMPAYASSWDASAANVPHIALSTADVRYDAYGHPSSSSVSSRESSSRHSSSQPHRSSRGSHLIGASPAQPSMLFAPHSAHVRTRSLSPVDVPPAGFTQPQLEYHSTTAYGQPLAPLYSPQPIHYPTMTGYAASAAPSPRHRAVPPGSPYYSAASTPSASIRASPGASSSSHPTGISSSFVAYDPAHRSSSRRPTPAQFDEPRAVPQKRYEARHPGMQDRIALHEGATKVVYFGENGVRVRDALAGKMRDMPGRDDVVLEDITAKTNSVRISWPGHLKSWRGDLDCSGHMTREVLAHRTARLVKRFFELTVSTPPKFNSNETEIKQWWIGPNGIKAHDLVLVGLDRVSHGSWQPILRFHRC